MPQLTSTKLKIGALPLLGLLLTGCPNPNTYGTPRTTPKGKISHTVAAEGIHLSDGADSITLPITPTYQMRIGVADELDVGVRFANMSTLGADLKWNFLRGEEFDAAINPGLQGGYWTTSSEDTSESASIGYVHLPVILGVNLSDDIAVVPTFGALIALASSSLTRNDDDDDDDDDVLDSVYGSGSTVLLRAGLGINVRINEGFALHPEATLLFDPDTSARIISFGLGFNFGRLPAGPGAGSAKAANE